jgi:hypothetical protein
VRTEPATRRGTNYVALAGEFLVLAELALRGLDGTLTLGQTKEVDILVFNRDTKCTFRVEVKTTGKGAKRQRLFGQNYDWLMHRRHQEITDRDLVYVFVYLDPDAPTQARPRFFVVPAADVAVYVRWNHEESLKWKKQRKNLESTIREFRIPVGPPAKTAIPPVWNDGRWKTWENGWAVFQQRG